MDAQEGPGKRQLLAPSRSISQGHRQEEGQAPWELPPTFQADHRATSQVGLHALGLTLGSDPCLSSMGTKRRLLAEPQSPRHATWLKAAGGGEPRGVFNIPGTPLLKFRRPSDQAEPSRHASTGLLSPHHFLLL